MEILHMIFIAPFLDMVALPDLFFQGLWDNHDGLWRHLKCLYGVFGMVCCLGRNAKTHIL